jgi:hypothetical protein
MYVCKVLVQVMYVVWQLVLLVLLRRFVLQAFAAVLRQRRPVQRQPAKGIKVGPIVISAFWFLIIACLVVLSSSVCFLLFS